MSVKRFVIVPVDSNAASQLSHFNDTSAVMASISIPFTVSLPFLNVCTCPSSLPSEKKETVYESGVLTPVTETVNTSPSLYPVISLGLNTMVPL